MSTDAREDAQKLRKAAVGLWFAVERMKRRHSNDPDDPVPALPEDRDDPGWDRGWDTYDSRVPRRPVPSADSAAAAVPEDRTRS